MGGIVTVVAANQKLPSNIRLQAVSTFDALVQTFIDNGDVTSYWKFHNTGTDERGVSNATITGSPELNVPTLVAIDTVVEGAEIDGKVIAWPGTSSEFAEAPHHASLKTSTGTIILYFQRDTANQTSQLIMADASNAAGGFGVFVQGNGAASAYVRGPTGTPVPLNGGPGDVKLDHAYCIILKWGPQLELVLYDGTGDLPVRRIVNLSTAGLSGTSPIRFGATHVPADQHDGPYGRVIWMNRSISAAEERMFGIRAKSIARSTSTYRTAVLGLNPFALWGLGELTGTAVIDVVGAHNGAITGTVVRGAADLPADIADGATNFVATGSATIPHDAAFSDTHCTVSFWFRVHSIPGPGELAFPLISKNNAVVTERDMVIYFPSDGVDVLRFRLRGVGGTAFDIDSPADVVTVGQAHHACVRFRGTSGFDAFLDGVYIGTNTGYTFGLMNNIAPLRFAASPTFTLLGNAVIDEVVWFERALSDSEILVLAQRSGTAPVATDDVAAVPESDTTLINVLANDSFVGAPTIEILTQPASGTPSTDFVTVVDQQIQYIAGAVASDTARSFTYRITDPNGTSNTATVNVTVLNAGATPDPIANCYVIGATTDPVASMAALQTAINGADPGDNIAIAAGTYNGGTFTFSPSGTEANPIVVRPAGARGSVTINNATWTLAPGSARIVFTNIFFNNLRINVNGQHHRITRCQIRNITRDCIFIQDATDTRIDHNDVSGYNDSVTAKGFVILQPNSIVNGTLRRVLIDYNYCHDVTPAVGDNGQDFIGCHGNAGANIMSGLVVDHNLFTNINLPGESELIGSKTAGIKFQFNTVINTGASCYIHGPRQSHSFEFRSNWFQGTRNPVAFARSDDVLVIGNRFAGGLNLPICNGDFAWTGVVGNGYPAARRARVIGNRMGSGLIQVGQTEFGSAAVAATQTNVVPPGLVGQNTRDSVGSPIQLIGGGHAGTTQNADPEAFVAAVQLAVADVGTGAADPLCLSGPQA